MLLQIARNPLPFIAGAPASTRISADDLHNIGYSRIR
jgi:hypothetical protein